MPDVRQEGTSLTPGYLVVTSIGEPELLTVGREQRNFVWNTSTLAWERQTGQVSGNVSATFAGNVSVTPVAGTSWQVQGNVSVAGNVSVIQPALASWQIQGNVSAAVVGNVSVAPVAGTSWQVQGNVSVAAVLGNVSVVGNVSVAVVLGNVSVVGNVSVIQSSGGSSAIQDWRMVLRGTSTTMNSSIATTPTSNQIIAEVSTLASGDFEIFIHMGSDDGPASIGRYLIAESVTSVPAVVHTLAFLPTPGFATYYNPRYNFPTGTNNSVRVKTGSVAPATGSKAQGHIAIRTNT